MFTLAFVSVLLLACSRILRAESPNKIVACKHGTFILNAYDNDISETMRQYGEWAEHELDLFLSIVKPGDIVIDVGANIGAFTVPLAKRVGQTGRVHSFEPQRTINYRLAANIVLNDLNNVDIYLAALGNTTGTIDVPKINYEMSSNFGALSLAEHIPGQTPEWTYQVPLLRLDDINLFNPMTNLDCPSFIKMDVERMERWVLQGGAEMIRRCRPIIHSENNAQETTAGLIEHFYEIDYVPYWDVRSTFNPDNFFQNPVDTSRGYMSMNIICIPREKLKSEGGNVVMVGHQQVERNRPFLVDYKVVSSDGKFIVAQHGPE